jgi:hypothetical protein
MDLSRHQANLGWSYSFVGDVDCLDTGGCIEKLGNEVSTAASTGATKIQLSRMGFCVRDDLRDGFNRQASTYYKVQRITKQHAERPEIGRAE